MNSNFRFEIKREDKTEKKRTKMENGKQTLGSILCLGPIPFFFPRAAQAGDRGADRWALRRQDLLLPCNSPRIARTERESVAADSVGASSTTSAISPVPWRVGCGPPPLLLSGYKSRHLDHFVIREL